MNVSDSGCQAFPLNSIPDVTIRGQQLRNSGLELCPVGIRIFPFDGVGDRIFFAESSILAS